jgi:flagellar L-ring protein precursor FlgH
MKIDKKELKLWGMAVTALLALSCTPTKLELAKDMPANYLYKEPKKEPPNPGSLWAESAGLFADRKARGLNDLVTITIVENSSAEKKAGTTTGRQSTMDTSISNFFGNSNILGNVFPGGPTLSPSISSSAKNDFTGSGDTTRSGSLVATITARVIDVLPNGNMIIESRKDITVNREKQLLLIRGVIRPEDVAADNTILSSLVANAEIIYTGDGVVNEKQGQGWMVRFLDRIWPF